MSPTATVGVLAAAELLGVDEAEAEGSTTLAVPEAAAEEDDTGEELAAGGE
jgi:hypothetical protein